MDTLVINIWTSVIFIKNSNAFRIGLGLFFIILIVFVLLIGQKLGCPDLQAGIIDRADDGSSIVGPLFFRGVRRGLMHRQFGFCLGFSWVSSY